MKKHLLMLVILLITSLVVSCNSILRADEAIMNNEAPIPITDEKGVDGEEEELITKEDLIEKEELIALESLRSNIIEKFQGVTPNQWGERVDGVINRIDTSHKVIALTFDACGGGKGSGYDKALIRFLIEENIPATLFISGGWIDSNEETLKKLADNPLFEIANHGFHHRPLSVEGKRAYNILGTSTLGEAFDEVYKNQERIYEVTGKVPKYFRSGTAYYDDVAVKMLEEMGMKAINYNVLGDAGATFTKDQIVKALSSAKEGSIVLFHMNRPHGPIAEGVREGVLQLKEKGFTFVHLSQYQDFLRE